MGLPVEVNNLMLGSLGGYTVGRSLRFRSSASAYLNRTPASASNRTTFTQSFWAKRGDLSRDQTVVYSYNPGTGNVSYFINFYNDDKIRINSNNEGVSANWDLRTTQVFRDPSAWYHIVVAVDTTQATSTDRVKVYINGVQVTSFSTATYPSLNFSNSWNNTVPHGISRSGGNFDGYLADFYAIDGQQLTPASFGYNDPVTGVWQPAPFKGTYGTNGFYLPFTDIATTSGSNFGLGRDYSGNANYWTTNNISVTSGSTYDSMIDSPTSFSDGSTYYNRGNYCVLSPLAKSSNITVSDGNLYATSSAASYNAVLGTIAPTSGKWYFEMTLNGSVAAPDIGWHQSEYTSAQLTAFTSTTRAGGYCIATDGTGTANTFVYNNGTQTTVANTGWATNDIIGCSIDIDNKKIWFSRNGTWYPASVGGSAGDPANGTNPAITYTYTGLLLPRTSAYSGGYSSVINFGQRPFTYTPPTGFKALNTFNLPTPTIANGAAYMAATLWTGTGSSRSISNSVNGLSFQPDFIWIKDRSTASAHALTNSVVGTTKYLESNTTASETTDTTSVTSINSDGFSLGAGTAIYYTNRSGDSFVGWQWKAGAGTTSSNTSGSITSTVSANTTAGFSVATFTTSGGSNPQTIGHGLGVAPSMIIMKSRNNTSGWTTYHSSVGNTGALNLSATTATSTSIDWWQNTSPTSSVWSIGANLNISGWTWVAYCFSAVRGYSAFGSYTGNGSTDGPFVYLGFRPRFVLIRRSNNTGYWLMKDSSRNGYNQTDPLLYANVSDAEYAAAGAIDILSNGFKVRASNLETNGSGDTLIYAAFAENPFNYSRAR